VLRRSPRVTYELVDDQAVLVDPGGQELLTLNPVGALVWEAIDGARDEQQIADLIAERFAEVDRSRIESDVQAFVAELLSSGLVVEDS
jgi:Coenzyme PQQ synthesis protein D (PqqD)